jgi:hypothetical protein
MVPAAEVREKFRRVKPLKEISVTRRGWTLDVLSIVRWLCEVGLRCRAAWPSSSSALPKRRTSQRDVPTNAFTPAGVYAFTRELEKFHPDNSDSHRERAATSAIKSASNSKCYATRDYCCTSVVASGDCREIARHHHRSHPGHRAEITYPSERLHPACRRFPRRGITPKCRRVPNAAFQREPLTIGPAMPAEITITN